MEQLAFHPLRGNLFEGWVVSELAKMQFNMGLQSNLYFWRDQKGHEIDVLFEKSDRTVPLEIKPGQTLNSSFFKGLDYWEKCSRNENQDSWLVYGGEKAQFRRNTRVISWMDLHELKIHF